MSIHVVKPGEPLTETPDWSTRAWGRPNAHPVKSDGAVREILFDFRYHGLRIRGGRVHEALLGDHGDNGSRFHICMPVGTWGAYTGETVYWVDESQREQFERDLIWVCRQVRWREGC